MAFERGQRFVAANGHPDTVDTTATRAQREPPQLNRSSSRRRGPRRYRPRDLATARPERGRARHLPSGLRRAGPAPRATASAAGTRTGSTPATAAIRRGGPATHGRGRPRRVLDGSSSSSGRLSARRCGARSSPIRAGELRDVGGIGDERGARLADEVVTAGRGRARHGPGDRPDRQVVLTRLAGRRQRAGPQPRLDDDGGAGQQRDDPVAGEEPAAVGCRRRPAPR